MKIYLPRSDPIAVLVKCGDAVNKFIQRSAEGIEFVRVATLKKTAIEERTYFTTDQSADVVSGSPRS